MPTGTRQRSSARRKTTAVKSVNKKVLPKKSATNKKRTSKKSSALPGAKLADYFNTIKKQTKSLVDSASKKVAATTRAEQNAAKKHKSIQDNLQKVEKRHSAKPNKLTASQVKSAKTRTQQANLAWRKHQDLSKQAKDSHSTYQNHLNKINHFHKLVTDADKNWQPNTK